MHRACRNSPRDNVVLLVKARLFFSHETGPILKVKRAASIAMAPSHQRQPMNGRSPRAACAPPRPPEPAVSSPGRPDASVAAGVVRGSSAPPPQPRRQPPDLGRRLRFSATARRVCARRTAAGRVVVDGAASRGAGGVASAPRDNGDAAPPPPGRGEVAPGAQRRRRRSAASEGVPSRPTSPGRNAVDGAVSGGRGARPVRRGTMATLPHRRPDV